MTEDAKLVEMLTRECSDLMKELIDNKATNVALCTEIKHLNRIIGRKKAIIFVGAIALGYCGYKLHDTNKKFKKLENEYLEYLKEEPEVRENDEFLS